MIREQVERFFGEDSPLRRGMLDGRPFRYEMRPQQVEMALAVADALDGGTNLCVEAPTGVGKTFAYLVPALLHARETGKAVVISTHTINLQEQIIGKDIPFLERLLDTEIRAVVAKGRGNYLCQRRLNSLLNMDQGMLAFDGSIGEMARLQRWARETVTGDAADLPPTISPSLWAAVCSERGNCAGAQCPHFKRCHLQRARRMLKEAELVISNHAKFFTELKMAQEESQKNEGFFPEYDGVILDEAHTIEDAASNHLGMAMDSGSLRYCLTRLYNPDRKTGLLAGDATGALRDSVVACLHLAEDFFRRVSEWMERPEKYKKPLRYCVPGTIVNPLGEPLGRLCESLQNLCAHEKDPAVHAEIQGAASSLEEQIAVLNAFCPMSVEDSVYWLEQEGRKNTEVSFHIVPINVAPLLQKYLFGKAPVVMTSATLAVNGNISYYQGRVGCLDARPLILGTPFDYQNQVSLHISQNMPEPSAGEAFLDSAEYYIKYYLECTQGRAFVLFTSYAMMNELQRRMENFFLEKEMSLFVQGEGLSPRKMLEKFRSTERAVIFGTSSFWTGVDVPGDALSNVIITRLPFAVPDNPIVEARSQQLEREGKSSFFEYSVPEAVLRFRQGFGRLIRTREDTGIVVVLDSRILKKNYGKIFLQSIPQCPIQLF